MSMLKKFKRSVRNKFRPFRLNHFDSFKKTEVIENTNIETTQYLFSAFLCFKTEIVEDKVKAEECLLLELERQSENLAIVRTCDHFDGLLHKYLERGSERYLYIIDNALTKWRYDHPRVIRITEDMIPNKIDTLFIAELTTEKIENTKINFQSLNIITPNIVETYFDMDSGYYIPKINSIYPIKLPELKFKANLDFLYLDMPARAGQQPSVGSSYIRKAIKRESEINFEMHDLDPIWYHRFHMHRLLDLGRDPEIGSGITISEDAWGYNERIWVDPRQWKHLINYFREDIIEIYHKIIEAKPKILAFSVHARNEWITRFLAKEIKKVIPEILIMVGGHSCYSEHFGRGAFPEFDYMVIGEADLIVGPLVKKISRGELPSNTPGVISKFDDPLVKTIPGPQPHNLDLLGGIELDNVNDFNLLYQNFEGHKSTAIPLTRGCVWSRCTFCAERFAFRTRSPKNYVDELELLINLGRGNEFNASDSDFGGKPEILIEICEEIIRRKLEVKFTGQIRLNKIFNVEIFKLFKRAGLHSLNFGADAFTENTIRLQAKGYTIDTLISNHRDCVEAGITPVVNIVIGVPGEKEIDIEETIKLLTDRRDCFPIVNNINAALLVQNSVYWYEPEKYNIYFYGDKEKLYNKYYFGIPARLWYSTKPFIDRAVRAERFLKMITSLEKSGTGIASKEVYSNFKDILGGVGHLDYRELLVDDMIDRGSLTDLF